MFTLLFYEKKKETKNILNDKFCNLFDKSALCLMFGFVIVIEKLYFLYSEKSCFHVLQVILRGMRADKTRTRAIKKGAMNFHKGSEVTFLTNSHYDLF